MKKEIAEDKHESERIAMDVGLRWELPCGFGYVCLLRGKHWSSVERRLLLLNSKERRGRLKSQALAAQALDEVLERPQPQSSTTTITTTWAHRERRSEFAPTQTLSWAQRFLILILAVTASKFGQGSFVHVGLLLVRDIFTARRTLAGCGRVRIRQLRIIAGSTHR